MQDNSRLAQRDTWLRSQGFAEFSLTSASADASFRSYWRVKLATQSLVLMDAPPAQEDCRPFVQVANLLKQQGLHVPTIHAKDFGQGFLLLEDLGSQLFSSLAGEDRATHYAQALAALRQMLAVQTESLPVYDASLIHNELALFTDWLLGKHLQIQFSSRQENAWAHTVKQLTAKMRQQPQVFVHRDYHCRNLMVSEPNPGIIDFQDAVRGPITYDLVSLLRDCYVTLPVELVDRWCRQHHQHCLDLQLTDVDYTTWRQWFDWTGIQRHLKAAGIFCRLKHRDGKSSYLRDVPRIFEYLLSVGGHYPEFDWLCELVDTQLMPAFAESACGR